MATMMRIIFARPDPESVWTQHRRVVDHLADLGMDTAADHVDGVSAEMRTHAPPLEGRTILISIAGSATGSTYTTSQYCSGGA